MIQSVADLLDPQCKNVSFLESQQSTFSVSPMLTVVQPWRGRHHVYSIFAIPNAHSISSPMLLSVKGIGQFRRDVRLVVASRQYPLQSGYYAVRTYLRTRLAVFLICQGLYWKLQNPNNWVLSYGLENSAEKSAISQAPTKKEITTKKLATKKPITQKPAIQKPITTEKITTENRKSPRLREQ